jgi:hypothetical protein
VIGANIRADLAFGDEQRFRGQGMINRDREGRSKSPGRLPSIRSQSQATAASQARHGMGPGAGIEVTDDEISQYSDNVQKRIRQLRAGYHEERREKERLAREQQEALTYASRAHASYLKTLGKDHRNTKETQLLVDGLMNQDATP